MPVTELFLADEAATLALGRRAAAHIRMPAVIYLHGLLGAGKTTFVRGYLQGLGYQGAVKSPTYAVVESYMLPETAVHHFDLYRFAAPEEWEDAGLDELFAEPAVCLIEWPQQGGSYVPAADWHITLSAVENGRLCRIETVAKEDMSWL